MMSWVELEQADFGYRRRAVVSAVSCTLVSGRCLGIYGPNGVGKTTLLRGLSGLLTPLRGTIRQQPGMRFGYLPQQRTTESHWPMSVLDAASLALSAERRWGRVTAADEAVISSQLDQLGVADLRDRPFFELSGGQQQRVMLAGALAAQPTVLMLDEPTSGLDVRSRDELLRRLKTAKQNGLAIVLVTHDLHELLALSDDALLLVPGEVPGQPSVANALPPRELAAQMTNRLAMAGTEAGHG